MKNLLRKLTTGRTGVLARKWVMAGMMFLSSLAPLGSLYSQEKINVHNRPDVFQTTDKYGSGDADLDGVVDIKDYDLIESKQVVNDRTDIDGDGIPSTPFDLAVIKNRLGIGKNISELREDAISLLDSLISKSPVDSIKESYSKTWRPKIVNDTTLLDSVINYYPRDGFFRDKKFDNLQERTFYHIVPGSKWNLGFEPFAGNHLPSQFNELKTKGERLDWFEKMAAIDKIDLIKPREDFTSSEFATLAYLNFHGHNGIISGPESKEKILKNGRFDLPLYTVRATKPYWIHNFDAILVGDSLNGDPRILENWFLYEPQTDFEVEIGKWNLPKGSKFDIEKITRFAENGGYWPQKLLTFDDIDENGKYTCIWYDPNLQLTRDTGTSVADEKHKNILPADFDLKQNYPNPFNPTTTIEYELPTAGRVDLDIYNILGQKLETLVDGNQPQGMHEVKFDASKYSSGVYLYRIQAGRNIKVQKMTLIK